MMKNYIKESLKRRNELTQQERDRYSTEICKKILTMDVFIAADILLAYYPYRNEVDILPVVDKAMLLGKKVYFPIVTSDTTMDFVRINRLCDFSIGYKGIKEPIGNDILKVKEVSEQPCCMLVPGSVFDRKGNRCGYGKGYYDRYLATNDFITKLGVCFSVQMMNDIPDVKTTDIPMNYIMNEVETINKSSGDMSR